MARVGKKLPEEIKRKILRYTDEGKSTVEIVRLVQVKDDYSMTTKGVSELIFKYRQTGTLSSRPNARTDPKSKILKIHREFINFCLESNPEHTTQSLRLKLKETFDIEVSGQHIRRIRQELGWKRPTNLGYCQLISKKNKEFRVEWCNQMLQTEETFSNVVFTDETTVELNACGRTRFYKNDETLDCIPKKAPKPKHAYKVHVWAGISVRGRTSCCVFTGIMDSLTYQQILADNLLPFTRRKFPEGFRLYQDNDSKHKSKSTKKWFEEVGILESVMPVPASSPDLNQIENVWADMKRHLRDIVKPATKDELVRGIFEYWNSLTVVKCTRFIDHIYKVIPHVILNNGGHTVY